MKHIIFIASILSLSSLVHAIGSQQLLKELSELQVINFSVVKQKSLSLPTVSSSLLSDEKLAEVFKSIEKYHPRLDFTSKFSFTKDDLERDYKLKENGIMTKLW